jgi:hypothetical protein
MDLYAAMLELAGERDISSVVAEAAKTLGIARSSIYRMIS